MTKNPCTYKNNPLTKPTKYPKEQITETRVSQSATQPPRNQIINGPKSHLQISKQKPKDKG